MLLDARRTDYIDPDVLSLIREFRDVIAPAHNVQVSLRGFKPRYELQDEMQFVDYTTRELQQQLTPDKVLKLLQEGNQRFRSGHSLTRDFPKQLREEVVNQHPIAVVLSGLGLSSAATEAAIKQLPGAITLSFTPYSRRLNEWVALARVHGHEVMLDLPMEPTSYPDDDPGPQALLTALSIAQNMKRLDWALGRATGYVGVVPAMGSRFTASREHIAPVLERIKARGLLFLDNRASEGSVAGKIAEGMALPSAVNDRFLDLAQASRVAVDARLVQIERIARTEGHAVAIGHPYPVTIERLRAWTADLDSRGFALAPISALVGERLHRKTAAQKAETQ